MDSIATSVVYSFKECECVAGEIQGASCSLDAANNSGVKPSSSLKFGLTPSLASSNVTTASCQFLRPTTAASDHKYP
jgi:hypothetical protein